MDTRKIQSTGQSFTLIPKFREEIDVRKLCQALIMAAKEKARLPDDNKVENPKT